MPWFARLYYNRHAGNSNFTDGNIRSAKKSTCDVSWFVAIYQVLDFNGKVE